MIPKPLGVAIVTLITVVWIANFGAQFLVPGYQVDGWVHTIFLSVVGGALAFSSKSSSSPPGEPGEPPPTVAEGEPPPPPPPPAPPTAGVHRAQFSWTIPVLRAVT